MKYVGICVVLGALLLLSVPAGLEAQFVQGYVYDATDSTGIASAHVEGVCTDAQGYFSTYTDTTGYYYVANDTLPSGLWIVTASHPQYDSQKKEVYLPLHARYLNFYLVPRDSIK